MVQDANTIVSKHIIVNILELLKTLVMIILLLVRRCKFELKDERNKSGSTYHVKKRFELLNTLAIVLLLCGDANTTVNKNRLRLL